MINQFWKAGAEQGGPNSWSRKWCPDNEKQEAGYFWFEYETQKPYFTEAWAIMGPEDRYIFKAYMQVGSSGSDVVALQKRLENEGVIEYFAAIINKRKLGKWLQVHCQVTLDKQTQHNFVEFEETIRNFSEVVECSVVSGGFDYLLKILVEDMEQYNVFYQNKLAVIEAVAHINSFFVMKEVKNTHSLPLDRWI